MDISHIPARSYGIIPLYKDYKQYSFTRDDVTYDKTNTYYVGYAKEMTIGDSLDEISEARWLLITDAKELLTTPAAAKLATEIEDYLESLKEYNW